MIRPIIRYGAAVLHGRARDVGAVDADIQTLIDDMIETMYAAPGIGLAAPQVGVQLEEEGCLSVPGLRGRVPRYTKIRLRAYDRNGQRVDFVAEGFHARVIQHECDHLWGKLYIDRVRDTTSLTFMEEFMKFGLRD